MKSTIRTIALLLVLLFVWHVPVLAFNSPVFGDVPQDHWAYHDIMDMTDRGILKGTGNGKFEPSTQVSSAMLLTIIGRIVYNEEVEAISTESDNWYSACVRMADELGALDGTDIDLNAINNAVSRYDVAKILNFYLDLLSIELHAYDTSTITDYSEVPDRYLEDVANVFASGLIKGYENGRFNGEQNMSRDEMAAVAHRLVALINAQSGDDVVTYKLTIEAAEGGTIPAGMDAVINGYYAAGDEISIIARPIQGYVFAEWTSSNGGVFADKTSLTTVFTMPDDDTVITGVFEKIVE